MSFPFLSSRFVRLVRPVVAVVVVASSVGRGLAQEPRQPASEPLAFTVSQLVDDVVAHNPEILFYEAELAAAKGERRTAGQLSNPEFSPVIASKRSTDPAGTLQGEGVAWTVAASQTFEWPGRLALRKAIADRQVALAELGLAQFRAALAIRARTLAYELAVAWQKTEATREIADRFLALQEIAVQRDPAGVAPVIETRILEANSITFRRRAADALKATRQAMLELNLLRGQPLETRLTIPADEIGFAPLPVLESLLSLARTNSFELRQKALELEQQGFRVDLARNERKPSVTVSPYYTEENAGGKDRFAGVGVSFPLPLWNRNKGAIDTAAARQQQAVASLQVARREVERKVVDAAATYEARLDEMSRWRADSVERFREAGELADRHYRLGAVPIATYVEMQKQSLDAREALLDSRSEAMQAALRLEQVTGTALDLCRPLVKQPVTRGAPNN
jgi:cobalt-zinc-cadmium efflux system outer membrane protein